jgi:tRNA/rRNA methyltransferase
VDSVVVVRPDKAENTGFIARLCANFDAHLKIVEPCFNLSEARQTASRAQHKLNDAQIFSSLGNSIQDLEFVLGSKPGRGRSLSDVAATENASVVIGPESSGLSNTELGLCDGTTHIETAEYSSLNQSHAAAVLMSRLFEQGGRSIDKGRRTKIREVLGEKTARLVLNSNPEPHELDTVLEENT